MTKSRDYYRRRHERRQTRKFCTREAKKRRRHRGWDAIKAKVKGVRGRAKDKTCMDCGVQHPPGLMTFDHVRGEKRFNLCDAPGTAGVEATRAEIEKCEVVCRFCHDVREHLRGTSGFETLGRFPSVARLLCITTGFEIMATLVAHLVPPRTA